MNQTIQSACARCARLLPDGEIYVVRGNGHGAEKCRRCALLDHSMVRRSLKVALLVGTILTLLNQADVILAENPPAALWWKIPLTYLVPYCVATYGAMANARRPAAKPS